MNRSILALAVLCLIGVADADATDSAALERSVALERLVKQDCGSCHGLTLKGGLGPDIRPDALSHYDREALGNVINHGVPGTPMPPWEPLLTKADVEWIVDYLLTGDTE